MTDSGEFTARARRAAPAPPPADLGIVAALDIEIAPLIARFREPRRYSLHQLTLHEGYLEGRLVALIVTGPGESAARRGTSRLLDGHRPRSVLSIGFAGGLNPALPRGHLTCPVEILHEQTGGRIMCAPSILGSLPPDLHVGGRMITVAQVVRTAADKAALRDRTGADLVDMESFAVATLCAERGIRFASVRIVSDAADVELPPEILTLVGPTGGYRIGAAIGAICKRPASLMSMLELRDHAHQAADRLATVVPRFIAQFT